MMKLNSKSERMRNADLGKRTDREDLVPERKFLAAILMEAVSDAKAPPPHLTENRSATVEAEHARQKSLGTRHGQWMAHHRSAHRFIEAREGMFEWIAGVLELDADAMRAELARYR